MTGLGRMIPLLTHSAKRVTITALKLGCFIERGKKRFEEDFDYANEEFFASWKNRFKTNFMGDKENASS